MITLSNVSKTFTGNTPVTAVKDVNLAIETGEIFGIIGFSGAGKSTLVRLINLQERPTAGKVYLDEVDLTELSARQMRTKRKEIGMIFQQFNLFPSRTVAQNVELPLKHLRLSKAERSSRVAELLKLVDLSEKANQYPAELSGGQKQRVAIARALASKPKVLLCDEATSALDPQMTHSILRLLKRLNHELGITIVLITHEIDAIKSICDRVAIMAQGEIVESGDVYSIFADPQTLIAKDFVQSAGNLGVVHELIADHNELVKLAPGEVLLKLQYLSSSTKIPLVSVLSRRFNVDFNIILADLEIIQQASLGGLICKLSGLQENITNLLTYLNELGIRAEVLVDARVA
ncbi:methionine ABC transporter ATP-binding protein [Arcanobacterium hippocoleae]|uniref:D-methionine transport system ATP-binding protein n=1 Tax=Arcanobacterium hippocoleae TaxID=149017 RepID=A0ABU1T074_9ACTO|nr:ATP-binding cassette domain-containing protein [Arcanobacterium hippocoleae]MDR6938711.1 D-methionine transport system ATP-binding protein [Arcanobacterium hippocoleae]